MFTSLPFSPIIRTRRARVGMAGQALHVLERDTLLEQVGNDHDAEGMGRVEEEQLDISEAAS